MRHAIAVTCMLAVAALTALSPDATPAAAATDSVIRIDTGGQGGFDSSGNFWFPDFAYEGGHAARTSAQISGTDADFVHQTERWDVSAYRGDIDNGTYLVRLDLVEIYFDRPGARVFDVYAEGQRVAAGVDIFASVGKFTLLPLALPVTVADGHLDLEFDAASNYPSVTGVEIFKSQPATTRPPTTRPPSTTTTRPPSATTTTRPPLPDFGPGRGRPYTPASAWNSPIPATPVLDSNSRAMAAYLAANPWSVSANTHEMGIPVYDADASTPRTRVDCTQSWGACRLEQETVPVPSGARANSGADGVLVVLDWSTHKSYEFWQARQSGGRWYATWGDVTWLDDDGFGDYGSTGSGIARLAGVVRLHELRQGRIDHALVFSTTNACAGGQYRYPASTSDGASWRGDCVPEGARVQLDPTINVDALPGITPGEKAVAKALQTYGAYVGDNGGSNIAIAFEKPTSGTDPYPAAGFPWDYWHMPHIPWTKLRVLRTWDGR